MFLHIKNQNLIQLHDFLLQENSKTTLLLRESLCGLFITEHQSTTLSLKSDKFKIPSNSWKIISTQKDASIQVTGPIFIFIFSTDQKGMIIDNDIFPKCYGPDFQGFSIPFQGKINSHMDIYFLLHWFQHNNTASLILHNQELDYSFNLLLIALHKLFLQRIQHIQTPSISNFEQIERYITDHIRERISVAKIATNFKITPEYLSSLFKKNEHTTVVKYINYLKISGAKDLIIRTNMSIKQVALYFGFTNIKYFYRLFKKETGITPSEYRRLFQY